MKSGKTVLVVDSVERAVKFYTEKLGFDVIGLMAEKEGEHYLDYAQLKKGKCFLMVRVPAVEELAEFSMIKRCTGRGAGMYIELKKGLDQYYERCKKKGVSILAEPKDYPWGARAFVTKDPFGLRLMFAEPIEGFRPAGKPDFCGMEIAVDGKGNVVSSPELIEDMIRWLRGFGILRRVSKKYAKAWLKEMGGKKSK